MQEDISLARGLKLSAGHALYCREDDALAIADLHLGYEAALQAEHVSIPRFQLEPMLERLAWLLERYRPEILVINGDLKHEFSHNKGQEWDEVDRVLDLLENLEAVVVRGNHDNYLQSILATRGVRMQDSFRLPEGSITFLHGHRKMDANQDFIVYGHEHPVIRIRDEVGAQVTLPCFLYDRDNGFIVIPAFSPLASGTNVLSPESSFMNPAIREMDISEARVFAIHDGMMDFGRVADLRALNEEFPPPGMKAKNTR